MGKARLQASVKFDCGTAVFSDCEDELEFLLFPWAEFHVAVQNPRLLHATRCGMETPHAGDLGKLRLKKKTPSLGLPRNPFVGLTRRIYDPRFTFLRIR